MSDDVLSVIATDPYWQPDRVAAVAATLASRASTKAAAGVDITWHDTPALVDCGQNLDRIGCPHCRASIDTHGWAERLEVHGGDGFASLTVVVPCRGARTSLEVLDYDRPCGFARFQVTGWNPERDWFDEEETTAPAEALGHLVRQIRAHI
ncbi:hypothetical protein KIK06_10330 [Nocardiopsis sp. EMB25]|uniref:hypothetical protein n=1 Tax=Nocardiopsis sp. EMB25 TaxID=2835867 RepID=UPI002283D8EA|nr:hypothetical protein [Nocardiopsis sp. EMB25]MCY9784288.1 hypothetical protein [Nocardiopsis sp. EMB25]